MDESNCNAFSPLPGGGRTGGKSELWPKAELRFMPLNRTSNTDHLANINAALHRSVSVRFSGMLAVLSPIIPSNARDIAIELICNKRKRALRLRRAKKPGVESL